MFKKILIANRGEIAVRIAQTARHLGILTVAVYSDADRNALHVRACDEAWRIGPAAAAESYLVAEKIIEVAKASGAEAIHPGYGFLSENAAFAEAVETAGLVFIGPTAESIRAMGLKDAAKVLMERANVPVVPGYHGENQDEDFLAGEADRIGYPVLLKAVAGGGGKGMRKVEKADEFSAALEGAKREALNAFGNDMVLIEKFIEQPRHIEVQVFADGEGNAVHLFERDCSIQRRHQKVVEEAPGPAVSDAMRLALGEAAVKAALAINYRGAGTIEFIAPSGSDSFYFMEMNTRLQVEHPVTELITGQDLVEWQFRVAAGDGLPFDQNNIALNGHAIEVRLYAENPDKGFLPATGTLDRFSIGKDYPGIRIDAGVEQGDSITPFYDPMIAKIIAYGETRLQAINRLSRVLGDADISGCVTNLDFLKSVIGHEVFGSGEFNTGFIEEHQNDLVGARNVPDLALIVGAIWLSLPQNTSNPESDPHSPFGMPHGWRLWSGGRQVHTLGVGGEYREITVTSHKDGGKSIDLAGSNQVQIKSYFRDGDTLQVEFTERKIKARILSDKRVMTVFVEGNRYHFDLPLPSDAAADGSDAENSIAAPLPGKIIAVKTSSGKKVRKGDALIILEAMKMEHTLVAPRAGVIDQLCVAEGDQVEEGTVLVSLEEAG